MAVAHFLILVFFCVWLKKQLSFLIDPSNSQSDFSKTKDNSRFSLYLLYFLLTLKSVCPSSAHSPQTLLTELLTRHWLSQVVEGYVIFGYVRITK